MAIFPSRFPAEHHVLFTLSNALFKYATSHNNNQPTHLSRGLAVTSQYADFIPKCRGGKPLENAPSDWSAHGFESREKKNHVACGVTRQRGEEGCAV